MKLLITGGTGFIASHVSRELLRLGHSVISLSRTSPPSGVAHERLHAVQGSFGHCGTLDAVMPGTDVVLHLGWSTVPSDKLDNLSSEIAEDILGSANLLSACAKHAVRKVVFISSGGTVYGFPKQTPIPETHATEPICSYGIAKLSVEKYLQLFYRLQGLNYVILRVSNAYGENQTITKGQGVIGYWVDRIKRRRPVEVWGDGSAVRDYIYVSDIVAVVSRAATGTELDNGVYNLGSGKGHSLNDILGILRTLSPSFDVNYRPIRKVDVDVNVLDTTRLSKRIDFHPAHSLEAGITRTWEHARAIE